jgi:hypothetical protein
LTIIILSSFVTSFLFAVDMKKEDNSIKNDKNSFHITNTVNSKKQYHKIEKSKNKRFENFLVLRYIYKLNLSKNQDLKIKKILNNTKPKMQSYSKAFKNGKFDKNAYIKVSMNKKKNMVEYQATLIGKIYTILSIKQKN